MTTPKLRGYYDRAASEPDEGRFSFVAGTGGVKRDGLDLDFEGMDVENYMRNPVFLWAHDYSGRTLPIGRVEKLRKSKRKMRVDVQFDLDDPFAAQVARKYDAGFLNAVSVGWDILKLDSNRVTASELLDVSAVPVPGDPDALIERQRVALRSLSRELAELAADPTDDDTARITGLPEGSVVSVRPVHVTDELLEDGQAIRDLLGLGLREARLGENGWETYLAGNVTRIDDDVDLTDYVTPPDPELSDGTAPLDDGDETPDADATRADGREPDPTNEGDDMERPLTRSVADLLDRIAGLEAAIGEVRAAAAALADADEIPADEQRTIDAELAELAAAFEIPLDQHTTTEEAPA